MTSRTFPETDGEQFTYDSLDNVRKLTRVPKTGSGLALTSVTATYETSWNHLASITDALGNETDFTYYPNASTCGTTGVAPSMMCEAQRPAVSGSRPTYNFQYTTTGAALGLLSLSKDAAGVTTTHAYDSYGNLTSTTEGTAAVSGNPALNLTTAFAPDTFGNVTATTTPLGYVSNANFDQDRRKVMDIEPTNGSSSRTASQTIYDANVAGHTKSTRAAPTPSAVVSSPWRRRSRVSTRTETRPRSRC